jgi:uracil-DNA glycosylase
MTEQKRINIPNDWYGHLKNIIESDTFAKVAGALRILRTTKTVYPKSDEVFKAFQLTPFNKIRVVIIGMDPYPTEYKGEPVACGLAFAPRHTEFVPPSLKQIYNRLKETLYTDEVNFIETDLNLHKWAEQGVFLLNAALTVEKNQAGSHLKLWKPFTETVIKTISENSAGVIFCFWGKDAQQFAPLVNAKFHHVLMGSHPVSAVYKGGKWDCNHFEEINTILLHNNGETIKWLNF